MKILLTGASGAVGTATLAQLMVRGRHTVTVFDLKTKRAKRAFKPYGKSLRVIFGDISHKEELAGACKDQDVVIHLAAIIPPLADDEPELAARVNTLGTQNLLACLQEHSPKAFVIYGSSIAVYGDRLQNPYIKAGDPLTPSLGDEYAKTKIAAERLVRESGLDYAIFRITAVFGANNHKISKLIFHMPLATPIEFITPEDAGRAFAKAVEHVAALKGQVFNLSGGRECRVIYRDFLRQSFLNSGLGEPDFPENSFATRNFHCAYYADGDALEAILRFRQQTTADLYRMQAAAIPWYIKFLTRLFRKPIRKALLGKSEPRRAIKEHDSAHIRRFFGAEWPGKAN